MNPNVIYNIIDYNITKNKKDKSPLKVENFIFKAYCSGFN